VLVENAALPAAAELPEPLQELAFRNGTPVRSDPDFHPDMDRLCSQLVKYLPILPLMTPAWVPRPTYGRVAAWAFAGIAACSALYFFVLGSGPTSTFQAPTLDGLRLDACVQWANRCGEEAASAWCKLKGYERAIDYPSENWCRRSAAGKNIGRIS
jgi:hypothetical protein